MMPSYVRARLLRVSSCLSLLLCAGLCAASTSDIQPREEVPPFLRLLSHGPVHVEPDWHTDRLLQARLEQAVHDLGLDRLADKGRLGIALVDLSELSRPRFAAVNGTETMYAASVPKLAVLYAAFQARHEGLLRIDRGFREILTRMIRVSSNQAASEAIQRVGFNFINSLLWQSGLYDPHGGGGLWLGKAYGGQHDRWYRDPVANTSHAASPLSLARLLTLIAQERLVDPESSREMKQILGNPGIHHKFVRGLTEARPGSRIYRKSGTWRQWHGDAAIIERGRKRYVATALCEDEHGSQILEKLIVALDDCVPGVELKRRVATF